ARGGLETLRHRLVVVVGVDAHVPAIERVAALHGHDERRARAARAVRLELLAQRVHEVADVAEPLAAGAGPERVGDDVRGDDAVALADQVLEALTRGLLEPLAAQRALGR